ncbi:MAG: cytochrome b/b6 domain-containing protein [Actinomycetota bacterium]
MTSLPEEALDDAPPEAPTPTERVAIERHRRGNRWMHWINFPLLTIMIWSGLRIYWADLRDPFGVGIGGWHWFELFPDWVNEPLGLNRKLARGMAFHFTFGWLFVINGTAFGLYLMRTGGWRNFLPTLQDLRTIPAVLLHEVGLRPEPPTQGKYNSVQQLVYGAVFVMGALAVLSGFAIYKPTQLNLLTTMFGGYEAARFVHFWVTILFVLFFVVHIVQVARAGFRNLMGMVTGYELIDVPGAAAERNEGMDDEPNTDSETIDEIDAEFEGVDA